MNVIVTGANGFIGKNVCGYLLEKGCCVFGIDLASTSKTECTEYIAGDLCENKIYDLLKSKNISFDAVVHLAADMRAYPYEADVIRNNTCCTQKMIEFCESLKVPVFVQLSSLPIIGTPDVLPITENHTITPPTVYHVSKYVQELLADYAQRVHKLRTVSFRICAPIGRGMNQKTIFYAFMSKALKNEPIKLIGKGTRKQNYIHVYDIAKAIYKSINSNASGVYNLASYNLLSNYELAEKIIEITGSKSEIEFLDRLDPTDSYVWDVSIDKLRKDSGFEPEVDIKSAIYDMKAVIEQEK